MKLSELQDELKKDLKIDPDDLTIESVRTPEIHWKYSKMLMSENLAFKKLEREMKVLYLQRWEYFRKKAPDDVYAEKPLLKRIQDADVKLYLAADEEIQEHQTKLDNKEELIDYLKRAIDQIAQRQWQIRNALEHRKFLAGGGVN